MRDALRGYLALAGGLSEITAARARTAARSLVEQGEATAGQVSALAEDLIATSRRNRESIVLLVRHEVEQTVRRLGLGASSDVEALTQRVRELERTVRELRASKPASKPASAPATGAAAAKPAAKGTAATKTAAKKTAAKKTAAKKTAAKATAAKGSAAKGSAAKATATKANPAERASS